MSVKEPVSQPEISVVIPCHNGAKTLGMQLEALTRQIEPPPFEVLVVDNRSDDDLARVVGDWSSELPGLRLVTAPRQAGTAYARNVGAAASAGRYLMFCDADDVVSRTWLRQGQRDFAATDVWTGSVISISAAFFGHDVDRLQGILGWDDELSELDFDENNQAQPVLCGGCFGIRTELFLEIGGFDQSFDSAGEDNELAWRWVRKFGPLALSKTVKVAARLPSRRRSAMRAIRRSAQRMVLLSVRYNESTPFLHVGWGIRNAAAGVSAFARGILRGRDGAPLRLAARERLSASAGALHGVWLYRLRTPPPARLAVGFDEGVMQRAGAGSRWMGN